METPSTDWDKIELEYRAGILTEATVATTNGITLDALRKAAKEYGWTRTILTPEDEATVLTVAAQEAPRYPIDSLFTNEDVKRQKLMTAGQIVRLHRDDIAKLRGAAKEMTDRLVGFLEVTSNMEAASSVDEDGKPVLNRSEVVSKLLIILGKDSAADLLEKLSRTTVRIVELERQAYGLESMVIPDDVAENAITKEIRGLADKIRQITADKAQRKEELKKKEEKDEIRK